MNLLTKSALVVGAILASTSLVHAECRIETGSIQMLGNEFAALQAVADRVEECASETIDVSINLTKEFGKLQVAALSADPAEYSVVITDNGALVPLMNEGLVRPLDDLVEQYGEGLNESQLIRVDGKVMAIAFMANAQHLFYRADILEQVGVDIPSSYEEIIRAAQAIRDAGIMEHPFATNSKVGWNLGEEFVNMYLGYGGSFFAAGSAEPAINNQTGIDALNSIKTLTEYSNPDFLTFDSNATQALWEAGEIALAIMWGSRGSSILDDEGSTSQIVSNTVLAGAPSVGGNDKPATTLWWDGFAIAANASDEDAEASFRAMMHALSPGLLEAHNDKAVWLVRGYQPTPAATGVSASASNGASPYPMLPYMGLLHDALGANLGDFLQGREPAEQALADAEAAYRTAAREKGFLN
ncbi:MAG: extracellular solute-binding protein [Roseitalea sp.]|nr:extracellular solute-binding protein [Roseitalea sp.]MBO6721820.1 extracellular solute-binding protein [Roseitalea sp.]MBO6744866.1 extracellular solute-binding protein [Roseitalea sp.]